MYKLKLKIVRIVALWSMRIMTKKLEKDKILLNIGITKNACNDAIGLYNTTIQVLEIQYLD